MNHPEHRAEKPSPATGLLATLSCLLFANGIGAPSARRLASVALSATAFALLLTAAPAAAASPTTFCPPGTAAGHCVLAAGVAVDQSSGRVYVADDSGSRIEVFDSTGKFLRAFGWGVLDGKAEPQVCTTVCQPGIEGSGSGQMYRPSSVAVDNSAGPSAGDLYVADRAEARVQKFTPAGEFILMFGKEVDKTTKADVCTAASGDECDSGHAPLGGEHPPLAVDSSGHVWVGGIDRLQEYSEGGEFISEVKLPGYGEIAGLALTPSGDFYTLRPSSGESDEEQFIRPPAGGQYTLSFGGYTTTPIAGGASGKEILHALEALPSIGAGNLAVGEDFGQGEVTFHFRGPLAVTDVEQIVSSGGATVTTLVQGSPGTPGVLTKRNPTGELIETIDASGHPAALGLDPATGHLFVSDLVAGAAADYGTATLLSFDSAGALIEAFGTGSVIGNPRGNALAFGDSAQSLYVATNAGEEYGAAQLFPLPEPGPLPEEAGEIAQPIAKTTATLKTNVNPEGASTTVHFQYITAAKYKEDGEQFGAGSEETFESGPLGEDFTYHPAAAEISGLRPDTAYRFRVVATNANGTVNGRGTAFTTQPPVRVDATYASTVSAAAATLNAQLNPLGDAGEYHFEYLTQAEYEADGNSFGEGTQNAPIPDAQIAKGEAELTVSQPLQGLLPATAYRFRILAHNPLGTATGPTASFTTQGPSAAALPDGRGWELVSPPDKSGVPLDAINLEGPDIQAAADGSGLAYAARGAIDSQPAGNRSFAYSELLARRGPSGWSTLDLATAHESPAGLAPGHLSEYQLFSSDLSFAALEPTGSTPLSPLTTERTPYLRQPGGEYTPLVTAENVPPGTKFGGVSASSGHGLVGGVNFLSASPDLAHLVLSSSQALTPGFTAGGHASLYEWSAGTLELLSQVPAGSATLCGGAGPACLPAAKTGLASELGAEDRQVRAAISDNGNRAVFAVGRQHLFLRDRAREETLQLDVLQPGALAGAGQPLFQTASADDSRVFFTDTSRLTEDSTATPVKPDLYMCEIEVKEGGLACVLTDLSVDPNSGESADVQGAVIGASADGSAVYFVANGALTAGEGAVHGNCTGGLAANLQAANSCNLYVSDTASAKARLVAVLSNRDYPDWQADANDLNQLAARVSPDGRWLAFSSQRPLTGYDNRDAHSGQADQEVFLYHAGASAGEAGKLLCASCNPTGARPAGVFDRGGPTGLLVDRPGIWQDQWLAASIPGWTAIDGLHALYQSRYLSDSGRLFFNSSDALVPQDSNGVIDVYQYEPPGVGGCTVSSPSFGAASGGCIDLISSGASPEESAFLDASETGNDVFFLTASQLAPTDVDGALDAYDAHVCSAERPCPPPPLPPPPTCEGDACQQPAVPPNDPTPGSLTFNGAGNVHQAKPKKHKKRHHKKSHKKKTHKRASSKHGGHK
ncbi:MAG: PD40 domain-containing protein [Solirubrobacterales bacterium]|nr:PD40 domain-containing protein [Solirubrobacterales bacterium]